MWVVEIQLHAFLTLALDGVDVAGERGGKEEFLVFTGNRTLIIQTVAITSKSIPFCIFPVIMLPEEICFFENTWSVSVICGGHLS